MASVAWGRREVVGRSQHQRENDPPETLRFDVFTAGHHELSRSVTARMRFARCQPY